MLRPMMQGFGKIHGNNTLGRSSAPHHMTLSLLHIWHLQWWGWGGVQQGGHMTLSAGQVHTLILQSESQILHTGQNHTLNQPAE